jgi:integrase
LLIAAGADPTYVQRAMRHASLRITLETYVHWWPKKASRRSVVGAALSKARADRSGPQDQN